MRRRFITADVFTNRPFSGNPLAVVLDAAGLTTEAMQAIAREFNYSETTFVLEPRTSGSTAWVRIFTPCVEVPFAGHPNIGTAVVLARQRESEGRHAGESLVFEEQGGIVRIRLLREAGAVVGAELVVPQTLSVGETIDVESAAACLSLPSSEIETGTHLPQVASIGLPFLVVALKSRDALRRSRPDIDMHRQVLPALGVDAVYAYCLDSLDGAMHARAFAPLDNCLEDPATGSATGAALALIADRTGGATERRTWSVVQGEDMGRPSLINGVVEKRDGRIEEVRIAGNAVVVTEGVISAF
ncbi:MAG: PhzF family phenazine biosynthesis protein [Gammaproteobacteria bacterium]|nr:PhzF family phenazine biosynthesis protein [Gammaproteobacteria bacterium]